MIWNRQGSTQKLLEIVGTFFPWEVEQMTIVMEKEKYEYILMWVLEELCIQWS